MLALPVIFSILLAMSPAMAALKPYCQEKITTGVYDFLPWTIDTLKDAGGNDIKIFYLEYGRADAQVTRIWIPGTDPLSEYYQGKLYFYAKGSYQPDSVNKPNIYKPWTVTLISSPNIYCDWFDNMHQALECTAKGTYTVTKTVGGGTVKDVCIEFTSYGPYFMGYNRDMIYVSAYDTFDPVTHMCSGNQILDAASSWYWMRTPQKHVTFTEFDNFAQFPVCKLMSIVCPLGSG